MSDRASSLAPPLSLQPCSLPLSVWHENVPHAPSLRPPHPSQPFSIHFTAGFLVVPDFLSPDAVAALRSRGQALLDSFDPSSPESRAVFSSAAQFRVSTPHFLASATAASFFFEEGAFDEAGQLTAPPSQCVNKIAHALHEVDPPFRAFARSPAVAGLASALGYQRPLPVQSMYICKQPAIGGEVVPHQDSTFLATVPSPTVFGVWVALEDATEENGCLWGLPGSHRGGVLRRFGRGLGEKEEGKAGGTGGGEGTGAGAGPDEVMVGFDRPAPSYDLSTGVPLPAKAGTLVLLHGAVIHWSAPNAGSTSRHAFTLHLAEGARGCAWAADNWLQRPADQPFVPLYDASEEGGGGGGGGESGAAATA